MKTCFLVLLLNIALVAGRAGCAEIVLRERAALGGAVVLLGDVAEVAGADAALAAELAAVPLMPTPAAGAARYLQAVEVRDLLAARGVDVRSLRFGGATAVAVGVEDEQVVAAPAKAGVPAVARPMTAEVAFERAHDLVLAYLGEQSGHQQWSVEVTADGDLAAAMNRLGGQLQVTGGRSPWTGYQRFRLTTPEDPAGVFVAARVQRVDTVVVARRAIERGDLIGAADVELRSIVGATSAQAGRTLDEFVGKEAVQAIRPESIVLTSQVRAPLVVLRGERVSVRARAAGVSVRTFATAQQDGSVGDLIMVQSLAGKERYAARVTGVRELEVFAAAPTAADLATTSRR
jgi:flagella basal body P-ring formation protein FlgA